jgi:FtsJ-like methyltransferase
MMAITSAMDLGAAPGGWTQVLLNHMNVTYVLAIDRAQLAPRDRFIPPSSSPPSSTTTSSSSSSFGENPPTISPQIFHVPTTLEYLNLRDYYESTSYDRSTNNSSVSDDTTILLPPKLFSYLVCDASVQWNVLLPMLIQQLQQPGNMNTIEWTIPSIVIITLKLPFKTIHSIRRHILDIQTQVPKFIESLSRIMYGKSMNISSRYRIVHCMANSDSERTLMVVFG